MAERVLVTGGRDYTDRTNVFRVLTELHVSVGVECVIEGGASGADTLAREWARTHLPATGLITEPADWKKWGPSAGPRRNSLMLTYEPTLLVAFPGGRGTADMIAKARRAQVEVWCIDAPARSAVTPNSTSAKVGPGE